MRIFYIEMTVSPILLNNNRGRTVSNLFSAIRDPRVHELKLKYGQNWSSHAFIVDFENISD